MPTQLRLHPGQLADLAEIRDTSPELLRDITERFQTVTPRPMRPKEMHREIAHILGDKPEAASRILRPLLSLQAIIRQRRLTADEVVEAVRYGLESSEPAWDPGELERWRSVEFSFKQLLVSPVARLVSATLDLICEYENLLQGARVVTDIQPVFSEDATQVEGAVISHTWGRIQQEGEIDYERVVEEVAALKRQASLKRTVLEEFDGFVDQIDGDIAHVTLKAKTGEILHGEYPASDLLALGIRERRRFKCRTLDTGLHVEIELTPIPDCEVSEERERIIKDEIRKSLGGDDGPQDDY